MDQQTEMHQETTATATHSCGRRYDSFIANKQFPGPDTYRADGTCSYCGSVSGDWFMGRLEAGTISVTPTDKSYKVYISNHGDSEPFTGIKFYFQHLTVEQQDRFIELVNAKKIHLKEPGYFYVRHSNRARPLLQSSACATEGSLLCLTSWIP